MTPLSTLIIGCVTDKIFNQCTR